MTQPNVEVLIVGGGVAGLEALLALNDLAGDRVALTLLAPRVDFVYRPSLVEEPFDPKIKAERYELATLANDHGAEFEQHAVKGVRPQDQVIKLDDRSEREYDYLVVCAGGRFKPALEGAITFPGPEPFRPDYVLDSAAGKDHRVAFVVPPGVPWSLPLYEIALMTQHRAREREMDVEFAVVTPESAPLAIFGPAASAAVSGLLQARAIEVIPGTTVREVGVSGIRLSPGGRVFGPCVVVALPLMKGPRIVGLPADDDGFLPIDQHARVKGVEAVYAAGDGTNFPVKQGGLGTQQADAAAEDIAHRLGISGPGEPFRPVLRGKLLTGDESLSLRADIAGGGGEGESSLASLWWPPHKIASRYLSTLLYQGDQLDDLEPPTRFLDVEVALPAEWHEEPTAARSSTRLTSRSDA